MRRRGATLPVERKTSWCGDMSSLPDLLDGLLIIGEELGRGGFTWNGVAPVYVLNRQPTGLEVALAAPDVPRARWRFIARTEIVTAWTIETIITNGDMSFRITALDYDRVPGLTLGLLEVVR
jgi:hypothetical protein